MALVGEKNPGTGWRAVFLEMLTGLREAVFRFPVATIFLLASAIQQHLLIADIRPFDLEGHGRAPFPELVMGLASGALAALAATLCGEARRLSRPLRSALALVAGLAAFALVGFPYTFLALQWTLILALIGLVPVAPFIGRGGSGPFWMFSARAAFAALLGIMALLLLAGGISAILATLTLLFGLDVPKWLYEHVWAFTTLFAAPLFGMGQLPDRFDEEPGEVVTGFMDRGMRALGDFLAAPLLIVYAVILHLYAFKIVVSGEVPEGQIGWLVLIYGLCIFGALLVINPFFDRARAPTRAFLRLWPFFLPVPLVLLFYALFLRVGEYGATPDRYLLGLFGVVTAIVVAAQILPRLRGDIRLIAALPIAALLLSGFGPQGALGVSLTSQANRFLEIVRNPPVEMEREREALGALAFLEGHKALARVAPEGAGVSPDNAYMETARAWGLDPARRYSGPHRFSITHGSEPVALGVEGYDTMVQNLSVYIDGDPSIAQLPQGPEITFGLEPNLLVVTAGEETVHFPISREVIEEMMRVDQADGPTTFPLEADGRRMMLVPMYIYVVAGEDQPRLSTVQGMILLNAEDWR